MSTEIFFFGFFGMMNIVSFEVEIIRLKVEVYWGPKDMDFNYLLGIPGLR